MEAGGAADTPPAKEQPVFVSYREERQVTEQVEGAKGPRKLLRFYLTDALGKEVLAATGEDQGDAHYSYRNAPTFLAFGTLSCHNRKELVGWLEQVMQESHLRAAGLSTPASVVPGTVDPDAPKYVSHRHERFSHPDGRRSIRFFLEDASGAEVLAVMGEERETRDGHYVYRTEPAFAGVQALCCGNMSDVNRWLDSMVHNPGQPVNLAADSGRPSGRDRDRDRVRSHKRTGEVPAKLGGAAEASHAKRLKLLKDEGEATTRAANDAYLAALWQKAHSRAHLCDSARRATHEWMRGKLPAEDAAALRRCQGVLEAASLQLEEGATVTTPAVTLVEALRELSALFVPLEQLYKSGVLQAVLSLRGHADPVVCRVAGSLSSQWRRLVAGHIQTLTDPKVCEDPAVRLQAAVKSLPRLLQPPRAGRGHPGGTPAPRPPTPGPAGAKGLPPPHTPGPITAALLAAKTPGFATPAPAPAPEPAPEPAPTPTPQAAAAGAPTPGAQPPAQLFAVKSFPGKVADKSRPGPQARGAAAAGRPAAFADKRAPGANQPAAAEEEEDDECDVGSPIGFGSLGDMDVEVPGMS